MKNQILLSDLRKEKHLTQVDLAHELRMSPSSIAMIESGSRQPTLKKAIIFADYFNMPVERIKFSNK